jgi:phosphatidylglycerophosphate synthase
LPLFLHFLEKEIVIFLFLILLLLCYCVIHICGNVLPTEKYYSENNWFQCLKTITYFSKFVWIAQPNRTEKSCSMSARQLTVWYVWFNTEACSDNRIAVSSVVGLYYHIIWSNVRTNAKSSFLFSTQFYWQYCWSAKRQYQPHCVL